MTTSPSPLTVHILLVLALHDANGADISRQISEDTQSAILVYESSLYKALHRMEREELITSEVQGRYTITKRGRAVLGREKVRILRAAELLRQRV